MSIVGRTVPAGYCKKCLPSTLRAHAYIFLATKWALEYSGDANPEIYIDSTPENCIKSCERSLKRLGVDSIDLFYCHRFDSTTPVEKSVEAMAQLKKYVENPHLAAKYDC